MENSLEPAKLMTTSLEPALPLTTLLEQSYKNFIEHIKRITSNEVPMGHIKKHVTIAMRSIPDGFNLDSYIENLRTEDIDEYLKCVIVNSLYAVKLTEIIRLGKIRCKFEVGPHLPEVITQHKEIEMEIVLEIYTFSIKCLEYNKNFFQTSVFLREYLIDLSKNLLQNDIKCPGWLPTENLEIIRKVYLDVIKIKHNYEQIAKH